MRIALFDWTGGGHHLLYVRRFVEALSPRAEVVVAASDDLLAQIADLPADWISLGAPRPLVDASRPLPRQHRDLAERELDLFCDVASRCRTDHLVHLYADPVIRRLVERPPLPTPVTLCIFFARAHYPTSYRTPLAPRELLRAWFLEYLVRRWQSRSDANAVFTLDGVAASRWSREGAAPAFWLPEPPVSSPVRLPDEREGCLLYGTLAPRKGLRLVTSAVTLAPTSLHVVLAGEVEPGFEEDVRHQADAMRKSGADVDLRLHRHAESEGLRTVAGARCVLLPYLNHYTGSRVLLEAATAGTPVVAHRRGLLGHLVREHRLGLAVDCSDPAAFREAILELADSGSLDRFAEPLRHFADLYEASRFSEAVWAPFVDGERSHVEPATDRLPRANHSSTEAHRMTHLVIGGAGFIGVNLAARLAKQRERVVVLDDLSRRGADQNAAWLQSQHPEVRFVRADIRTDLSTVQQLVNEAEIVYHLAAQVAVTTSVEDPRLDFGINLLGTLNVLEAVRLSANQPILIFSSTNKVYGQLEAIAIEEHERRYAFADGRSGITEDDPLDFHSPYGCSKGAADQYVRDYARVFDLKTVVLRQSCIYGPRQFGIEDQGWLAWFTIAATLGRPVTIYGTGKQVRDVLHVSDLIDLFATAIDRIDVARGKIYNVGGGLPVVRCRYSRPWNCSLHASRIRSTRPSRRRGRAISGSM